MVSIRLYAGVKTRIDKDLHESKRDQSRVKLHHLGAMRIDLALGEVMELKGLFGKHDANE